MNMARKTRQYPRWAAIGLVVACFGPLAGQAQPVLVFHQFTGLYLTIPDGDPLGVSYTANLSFPATQNEIVDLRVNLELSGGSNGDLYVQLTHGTGYSVLLNRVGRRADDLLGYDDAGMNVTFADGASQGDVHQYRLALNGDHNTPLNGPLTGVWAPDGRSTDPANTLDTDPRTQGLSSLVGTDPNGEWTLYLLDAESGDQAVLESWGLTLTVVPEPGETTMIAAFALAGLAGWRRCGRRRGP